MSNPTCISHLCISLALLAAPLAVAADGQISGPFTHDNLSIYLIHSARNATTHKLLTLQEAMDQKKAVVYETGSVNELSIENKSSQDVYVQSGDIVKGGRQDRVLTTDFILPAHSGKLPIAAFCVEQGRWTKRGSESDGQFGSSSARVAGKDLNLAVRGDKANQQAVWGDVAKRREGLALATNRVDSSTGGIATQPPSGIFGNEGRGTQGLVHSNASAGNNTNTSMQLAMESKAVVEATDAYLHELSSVVDGYDDVVGFAYAINGELNSAEVYESHQLFLQMWPKLLRASTVDALTEKPKAEAAQTAPETSVVAAILAEADLAPETSKQATSKVTVIKKESSQALLFETRDPKPEAGWMHRSYVVK